MSETQGSPKAPPETPAPAPAPDPLKQMQEMAEAGDFAGLVESFTLEIRAPEAFLRETLLLANLARSVVRPLLRGGSRHGTD